MSVAAAADVTKAQHVSQFSVCMRMKPVNHLMSGVRDRSLVVYYEHAQVKAGGKKYRRL